MSDPECEDLTPAAPTPATRHHLWARLAAISDAQLQTYSVGWLLLHLNLLRDSDVTVYTRWKRAENALQATERLLRLALKHEDTLVAQALTEDADYLRSVLPVYQDRAHQCFMQYWRLWQVLETRVAAWETDGSERL
jgi:hypothetical protein